MFKITHGKGFHMAFANGYEISVQWGPGNYCENYSSRMSQERCGEIGSETAEIAIVDTTTGNFHRPEEWSDNVNGYVYPDDVLKWMNYAASLER